MGRPRWSRLIGATAASTLRALACYVGWSFIAAVSLALRPPFALGWLAATVAVFLLYPRLGPERWRRRRAATLHLRPIGASMRHLLMALPLLIAGLVLLQLSYSRHWGTRVMPFGYPFAGLPLGSLVVLTIVLVETPLVEEFAFRGHLQAHLSRSAGHLVGGALGAAVFAAIHGSAGWLLYYFLNGALLAYVLVATGSIWACVLTHAAINGGLSLLDGAPAHWLEARFSALPSIALALAGMLLLASAVAALNGGWRGGWTRRRARTQPLTLPPPPPVHSF